MELPILKKIRQNDKWRRSIFSEEGKISPAQFRDFIRTPQTYLLTDEQIDHAWNAIMIDIPVERVEMLKKLQLQI